MGNALVMKFREYTLKRSRDPCPALARAIGEGTFVNDRAKIPVDREGKLTLTAGFFETAGNSQFFELEDRPPFGAMPG
jgi:hypothetical protein